MKLQFGTFKLYRMTKNNPDKIIIKYLTCALVCNFNKAWLNVKILIWHYYNIYFNMCSKVIYLHLSGIVFH